MELLSSKPAGWKAGKSTFHCSEGRWGVWGASPRQPRLTLRPENPLSEAKGRPYRKPTQVGGGKYPQVIERTLVKELGKLTP